jgi:hypothetical protein
MMITANDGATREHYQPLRSIFSPGSPTTTESTELGCLYADLLNQLLYIFFTLFEN